MKICSGCGAYLQDENVDKKGYTPKLENELCQRCFKIKHYDDLIKSYADDFDNYDILNEVNKEDRLVLWIVDLFDFESNIIDGLNRHLLNKDIILVGTKRDLLPESLNNHKLYNFILKRLKFHGIFVKEMVFTGYYGKAGSSDVLDVIDHYRNKRDVIIIGQANVGKSTLINEISKSDITISRYPGTTLDLIKIPMDGYNIFDTPGLIKKSNIQYYVDESNLSKVIPNKIKPKIYQINKDSSFAIGGLVRVDVKVDALSSLVFFVNDNLNIHRSTLDNADKLWENHFDKLFSPTSSGDYKYTHPLKLLNNSFDLVINGLGFIKFSGNISDIKVYLNENVEVMIREALI